MSIPTIHQVGKQDMNTMCVGASLVCGSMEDPIYEKGSVKRVCVSACVCLWQMSRY